MPRVGLGLAVVAASVLLLTGCSAPLGGDFSTSDGGSATQCVSLARGERALIGGVLVAKDGPVVLRGATLADSHGVRVLHTWALPMPAGGIGLGTSEMPPTGATAQQLGWDHRRPVAGAAVPAHGEWTVALEVETTAVTGAARAVHVETDRGGADASVSFVFRARC